MIIDLTAWEHVVDVIAGIVIFLLWWSAYKWGEANGVMKGRRWTPVNTLTPVKTFRRGLSLAEFRLKFPPELGQHYLAPGTLVPESPPLCPVCGNDVAILWQGPVSLGSIECNTCPSRSMELSRRELDATANVFKLSKPSSERTRDDDFYIGSGTTDRTD